MQIIVAVVCVTKFDAASVEVKGTGKDSFLSQVIALVKQAQESKSKTQDLANTAAMWLTVDVREHGDRRDQRALLETKRQTRR